ncbi:MAG: acyl-CoA dehydrogenase family protein, partial [Candidatus Methylomirabilis sp.]|nr:acyl-CoA dehydrogenase family protein [Deltaproteobacteria bacterium]
MDFNDSPAEAAFRAEARAFLEAHAPKGGLPDYLAEHVDEDAFLEAHRAWQRTMYAHGWAAITWPAEHGGRGAGPMEQIIWNQEKARVGIGESLFVVGVGMAGPTIVAYGSEEQKKRYLPPMLRADEVWCQLFSEPGAGSDLANVSTRAERDGDFYVVNGQKVWSSSANHADFGILLARTNPNVAKHKGITYFLVDMKTPGVSVRPLRQMTGSSHFCEVFFEDARVPASAVLAGEGMGWACAMTTLMNERMAMGGIDLMFNFDMLAEHARRNKDRVDGVMRDELARLYCWCRTMEFLNARMLTKMSRGENPMAEASIAKLAIARIVSKGADLGLRLLGPDALLRSGDWQNRFL